MTHKYTLIPSDKTTPEGKPLFQIKALKSFNTIIKGDLGGYIEQERNLDQQGDAWIYGNAQVYGDAWIYGNANVCGYARVFGYAVVFGNAEVYGDAWIYGNANVCGYARVFGNANVCGDARVYSYANTTKGLTPQEKIISKIKKLENKHKKEN